MFLCFYRKYPGGMEGGGGWGRGGRGGGWGGGEGPSFEVAALGVSGSGTPWSLGPKILCTDPIHGPRHATTDIYIHLSHSHTISHTHTLTHSDMLQHLSLLEQSSLLYYPLTLMYSTLITHECSSTRVHLTTVHSYSQIL